MAANGHWFYMCCMSRLYNVIARKYFHWTGSEGREFYHDYAVCHGNGYVFSYEPCQEKTCLLGFRPCPTQTRL